MSPDFADLKLSTGSGGNVRNLVFDDDLDGWMVEDGQDAWSFRFKEPVFVESAPGGIRRTYSQIMNEWDGSALKGKSLFTNLYMPERSLDHMMITLQSKPWFLNELSKEIRLVPMSVLSLLLD